MPISQTNFTQLREIESLPLNSENKELSRSAPALHQVFKKDRLTEFSRTTQIAVDDAKVPTFWKRLYSWFIEKSDVNAQNSLAHSANAAPLKKMEPIELLPELEAPDAFPVDLQEAILPPQAKSRSLRKTMTQSELAEGLSQMSQHTIEEIMTIILQGQLELEKENAYVAENTFTKYQKTKKLREKVLEEIKDALAKDEKVLGWCKTGQNIALAASFVCGIATAAATFGLLPANGSGAFFSVLSGLATFGPAITAGLTGLATGSKAYSQRRLNEDRAMHEQFSHQDRYTSDRIEDARERLMATAEMDQVFKETMVRLLKRFTKMGQLVMQK